MNKLFKLYLSCMLLSTRSSCDGEQGLIGRTSALSLLCLDLRLLLPRNVTFGGSTKPYIVQLKYFNKM